MAAEESVKDGEGEEEGGLGFDLAAQPDMVLAMMKDLYYTKQLKDQLKDIAERVLGPRRAELLDPEVRLLGDLLYYTLTIWAGGETLGQEYCNLTLVQEVDGSNNSFIPLTPTRRAIAVLAMVLLFYTSKRLVKCGGWRTDFHQLTRGRRRQPQPPPPSSTSLSTTTSTITTADAPAAAPLQLPSSSVVAPAASRQRPWLPSSSYPNQVFNTAWQPVSQALTTLRGNPYLSSMEAVARDRLYPAILSVWERLVRPSLPETSEAALRLADKFHLMLFFLHGRYYTLAFRLARARTMFTRLLVNEERASYRPMGMFIAIELYLRATSSLVATWKRAMQEQRQEALEHRGASRVPSGRGDDEGDRNEGQGNKGSREGTTEEEEEGGISGGPIEERRKCSLCMGLRKDPAVTPCGHVFCWSCILSWCATQPECPLCRSRATPQSIIYVINLGQSGE